MLTPADRLSRLRSAAEDQWFDRRSARVTARSLAETLVAFANAEGGVVAIGLTDREPTDAGADPRAVNAWRQAGIDFAHPPIRYELREMEWTDATGRVGIFVLVEVPPSETVHGTTKDEVFLRIGDENRKLTFAQRRELLYDKGQAQYGSTTPADWEAHQLHLPSVERYSEDQGALDTDRLLAARGLVAGNGKVTVAGMLMFGIAPDI